MKLHQLALCLFLSIGATAAHTVSAAAAGLPSLEQFFENSSFNGAKLSPDGRYLAARLSTKGKRDWLSLLDLDSNKVSVIVQMGDSDVNNFEWISNQRLLFNAKTEGVFSTGLGVYAINRDGSMFRNVGVNHDHRYIYMMGQPGAQDSEYVHLYKTTYDDVNKKLTVAVTRMNTLTVESTSISRPGRCNSWLLDHHGEPRICTVYDENVSSIHYLDPANGKWRKLISWEGFAPPATAMWPLAFGPDGTLYMVANAGQDTTGVYAYDLVTNRLADQPLIRLKGYDFEGHLVMDQHKLLGITYRNDAVGTLWFAPKMKALQAAVDALLPDTINRVTPPRQAGSPWVLVGAYSDVQPLLYFVYNSETKELRHVGSTQPGIKAAQMSNQDLVHYHARDGLEIPAWLWLPQGKSKNLPLVLLVHDGPNVRGDSWGWDPETQFLASRGYAVLEPEYRGSTGFGDKHFRAGWKQWGLKMQDDLADGVKWAITQGIADPKRVCIAGTGYGGYAALMGLANDPELYRCGVDWTGFTDLSLLYQDNWRYYSDASDEWRHYDLPTLVGDAEKDAEQLKNTSPVNLAQRIQRPLLMAYGGSGYHVPLVHGTRMRDALKANHQNVEWVEYLKEGHGWYLPETRYDFWGRVEKFLAKNIGEEAAK